MKNFIMIVVTMSFLFLNACSSVQTIPDAPTPKALAEYKAPDWVLRGGGAFTDAKVKHFMV